MTIDLEYAIKKDIRNNPVIREVDARERREIRRTIWLAVLSVAVLLFVAWQYSQNRAMGYALEALRLQLAQEEAANRKLRLAVDMRRSPAVIERRALRELGMVAPAVENTLIVERVTAPALRGGIVAQVH
jgi:hypothetical protein